MFPGNQLLLLTPGVDITASDRAVQDVRNAVEQEVGWMDFGTDATVSAVTHRYQNDPMVMRLLEMFIDAAGDRDTAIQHSDDLSERSKPWPKN